MSGIYIPGMEMPTTGLYLVSVDNSCGKDETVMTVKRMLGNRDVCQIIGAYSLVPVPDHGRLIDADALDDILADQSEDAYNRTHAPRSWERALSAMRDYLEDAPTIIPADKEGEG